MDVTIKKCPHCGGAGYLNQNYSYKTRAYFVFVKCTVCGAQAKSFVSDTEPAADGWNNDACNDAIAAWNLRVPESAE